MLEQWTVSYEKNARWITCCKSKYNKRRRACLNPTWGREKVGKRRKRQASELRDADSCGRNTLCQALAWLLFAIVHGEH
jgi:hypothetical protein